MNIQSIPVTRFLSAAIMAAVCLLPQAAEAKPKYKAKANDRNEAKANDRVEARGDDRSAARGRSSYNDRDRVAYRSQPRSGFTLSFGTGYAGRGYYYGPPRSAYYYERPEVRYYATREAAPREYYGRESYQGNSPGAAVQQALARRGYYRGSIDGQIGPQSRRAIARYQEDRGLRITGSISSGLLHSLGL